LRGLTSVSVEFARGAIALAYTAPHVSPAHCAARDGSLAKVRATDEPARAESDAGRVV
jgi:hypothetical protein